MNEISRITEEIIDLESKLSDCLEDDRLEEIGHYESEIQRLTTRLERLARTERKIKPNNSKWMF